MGLFSVGSALCGLANSLPQLVVFRVIQGMGGAMMVPVGRLILLRSIPPQEMVSAMVWFTVPGAVGRVAGPLLGGIIVTLVSWRWIFLLNIPFGVLGILMARAFLSDTQERIKQRFDIVGFILLSLGLVGLVSGLDTAGRGLVPAGVTITLTTVGALCVLTYWYYTRRVDKPVIDPGLFKFKAYRTAVAGGMPLRVALGASPFLLPLMLQLGFGLTPLMSGLLTMATAIGSLCVRALLQPAIRRFGFKAILVVSTLLTGVFYALYGLFTPDTSHTLIFAILLFGGLFNSFAMVTLNTLGYSDVPPGRMSQATALSSMGQQFSLSLGVAFAAFVVTITASFHGHAPGTLGATDFSPAFIVVGALTWCSLFYFYRLSPDEGAEMRGAG
ncbi:MFS transporter, partial [Candidimonas nitroreducens]